MTNNVKLQTLMRLYTNEYVVLYDIQYDIKERYTKKEILSNEQLCKMKVLSFDIYYNDLLVIVEE